MTHYDRRLARRAAAGQSLWILGREAMALVEFCFLRDLGYDGPDSLLLSGNTPLFRSLMEFHSR